MSQLPDDASSMSDDVFEDAETTQKRLEESRKYNFHTNNDLGQTRGTVYYGDGAVASTEYCRSHSPSGYPGYRPPREALQLYALEDAVYTVDDYDDGWRSYHYDEVGMQPAPMHLQPFDDTVNHKTILLGDSGVGKTSFLVKYNTGEFRLGSFSATVGIALTQINLLSDFIRYGCHSLAELDYNINSVFGGCVCERFAYSLYERYKLRIEILCC
uniref:Ras-related protein Rab-26 n=1 Tax=Glossina palpalis gambiensis TaxID=67801 RepID=A0A1B0B5L3_9MUSC